MKWITLYLRASCAFLVFGIGAAEAARAREFTVVAYNVENLFDVDGIAIYQDYTQDEADDPLTYTRRKLLTKVQTIAAVLGTLNDGAGPELVLFQELEADFTPQSSVAELEAFLRKHRAVSLDQLLGDEWLPEYAGLPSQAWLLKGLSDAGLHGYSVVVAPSKGVDAGIAHTNAVFSRFPIESVQLHALERARDILEVTLNVDGHALTMYVNHWKSGASNPALESIRVQNATVLRELIDARLADDPMADIIIGGDLNSHYNHSVLFSEVKTGINAVLGSQGDELAIRDSSSGVDLYNFWYELPPAQRYSEVWRGNRGSLMHLLVTRGLYDRSGVRYVDGSFAPLVIPGVNADALRRPLKWNFVGETGGGASDHFPVLARFTVEDGGSGDFVELLDPSVGEDALDYEMPLRYERTMDLTLPEGAFLHEIADADLGQYVGRLYRVDARVLQLRPLKLEVGGVMWSAYAPDKKVYAQIKALQQSSETVGMVVQFGIWKGKRQFTVEGLE